MILLLTLYTAFGAAYFGSQLLFKIPRYIVFTLALPLLPFWAAAYHWKERRAAAVTILVLWILVYVLYGIIAYHAF